MSTDEAYWRTIRASGREAFITRRAVRYGAPIGAWLAMIAALANIGGGDSWHMAFLAASYFFAGSIVLVTVGAQLEWRYLSRKYGDGHRMGPIMTKP